MKKLLQAKLSFVSAVICSMFVPANASTNLSSYIVSTLVLALLRISTLSYRNFNQNDGNVVYESLENNIEISSPIKYKTKNE